MVVGTDISYNTLRHQNYKVENVICCNSADALQKLYEAAGQGIEITKETLHLYIQDTYNQEKGFETIIKTPKK